MKILHVLTGGLRVEGIASTQLMFFKNMDMNKFQIDVAAVHNNSREMIDEYRKAGCNVIIFPDRMDETVKYFFELMKCLKKNKYDIIHVHGSSALMSLELLAADLAGISVRIAHSRNTKANYAKVDKMLRPLFNHLYTNGVACGEDAGKWLFRKKEFMVLHNGKNFSEFCYNTKIRTNERKKYNLDGKTVIGHVGVFNYQKNQEYLVRVFAEYLRKNKNAVLYLIGDGSEKTNVQKKVKELHLEDKIIFAGNVRDVPQRLQAMDIMVFPSRFEGLPNVVLEWQAEGLPCLISDKITKECAPSDLVAFTSIEDDPKIWADKIEQMLEQFTNREEQAKRGTQALKENGFDIIDATKELENMYLKLAAH